MADISDERIIVIDVTGGCVSVRANGPCVIHVLDHCGEFCGETLEIDGEEVGITTYHYEAGDCDEAAEVGAIDSAAGWRFGGTGIMDCLNLNMEQLRALVALGKQNVTLTTGYGGTTVRYEATDGDDLPVVSGDLDAMGRTVDRKVWDSVWGL